MKELSSEKMQNLQGEGWFACAAMVGWGILAVGTTVAVTAGGPITWGGAGLIVGEVAAMMDSADSCVN
ncbi:MAG: hypothetical protein HRU69_13820 [Flammeovirgaceae bacterium]|nr:MAG: hypothetical protein HRU69_13820 [Flammeovirgaceae bacterium]